MKTKLNDIPEAPDADKGLPAPLCSADCAAQGADTISRQQGLIDNEMRECIECGTQCRWDMVDHPFFGFAGSCKSNS